jgi:Flp pilus assembly protein TadD, contains TPR repeats
MMMKPVKFLAAAAILAAAVSCASIEKMAQMAENVKVTCDPSVLVATNGSVDALVSVTYPADYFNPKAILEVTPVLVYEGGEAKMRPFVYQGEKVKDNYKVVSSAGQTVTERVHFDYVPGMEQSRLELRGVARKGEKYVTLPVKKVADGVNTTYMLVKRDGFVTPKADAYQDVISSTAEGQIKYLVNSADVRNSELKGKSVKDFLAAIDQINADERTSITGTEILAYASPEGPERKNNELADKRSASANKALKEMSKKHDNLSGAEVKSLGEDWEGFQQLVKESNIEDKELILRVLSMYSDPAVRENEIRNMSQVFTALKGEVLPELRRARLIANVEYQNYTSEELLKLLNDNADVLDEEALLRTATLVKDNGQKEEIYKRAVNKFNSERAQFNLAALYLSEGKLARAEEALGKVRSDDPDALNAKGVIALRRDDLATAANCFRRANTPDAKKNLGIVQILTGDYEDAAKTLADVDGCCHNTVLAYILTDQLDKAAKTVSCKDQKVTYLKAIIAARKGDAAGVRENLGQITNADLRARAEKDVEFAGYTW